MRWASRMGRRDRVKLAEEKSLLAESGGRPCLGSSYQRPRTSGGRVLTTAQDRPRSENAAALKPGVQPGHCQC